MKLGSGSFGSVFYNEKNNTAVKKTFHEKGRKLWINNLREIDIVKRLGSHPNIVTFKDVTYEESNKYNKAHLHMEYYDKNLNKYIKENNTLLETQTVRKIMIQILLGLEYLHSKKIIHRDIKAENILIRPKTMEVAICDFGMADINMRYSKCELEVTSPMYRAPEIFLRKNYTYVIDSWAVGIIFYRLLYNKYPFKYPKEKIEDLEEKVENLVSSYIKEEDSNKRQKISIEIDKTKSEIGTKIYEVLSSINLNIQRSILPFHILLKGLLEVDPKKRMTISSAIQSCFFNPIRESHVDTVHKLFPPISGSLRNLTFENIKERLWMQKYTNKFISENKNYGFNNLYAIVFHGLDIFEKYLNFCRTEENFDLPNDSNKNKYLTQRETYLYLYTCFYIAHKYYSVTTFAFDYEDFFPSDIMTTSTMNKSEEFEKFILETVLNYSIFEYTFYEIEEEFGVPTEKIYQSLVKDYFKITCNLDKDIKTFTSYRSMKQIQFSELVKE